MDIAFQQTNNSSKQKLCIIHILLIIKFQISSTLNYAGGQKHLLYFIEEKTTSVLCRTNCISIKYKLPGQITLITR